MYEQFYVYYFINKESLFFSYNIFFLTKLFEKLDTLVFSDCHIGRHRDLEFSQIFWYTIDPHDLRVMKWGQTSRSAHRVQRYELFNFSTIFLMLRASLFTFLFI